MRDILLDVIDFIFENAGTFAIALALFLSSYLMFKNISDVIESVGKENTGSRKERFFVIVYFLFAGCGFYEIADKVNLISRNNGFGYYISFGAALICALIFIIKDRDMEEKKNRKIEKLYRLEEYCSDLEKENEQLNKRIDRLLEKNG